MAYRRRSFRRGRRRGYGRSRISSRRRRIRIGYRW